MAPSRKKNNFRDHGGGLDAAVAQFGGAREDWLDLSTGEFLCAKVRKLSLCLQRPFWENTETGMVSAWAI